MSGQIGPGDPWGHGDHGERGSGKPALVEALQRARAAGISVRDVLTAIELTYSGSFVGWTWREGSVFARRETGGRGER